MKPNLEHLFLDRTEQIKNTLRDVTIDVHDNHSEGQLIMEAGGCRGYAQNLWSVLPNAVCAAMQKDFADTQAVKPHGRPYSLPILNNCIFLPWRVTDGGEIPSAGNYPRALLELLGRSHGRQGTLFDDPYILDNGSEDLLSRGSSNPMKVIFIAVEANSLRLETITWGEVVGGLTNGSVEWLSREVLHKTESGVGQLGHVTSGSFTEGPIPPNVAKPRHEGTAGRE